MASAPKQKEGGIDRNLQDNQSRSSVPGSSRYNNRPIVPRPRSVPTDDRAHRLSQNSALSLAVTRTSMGPQITPARKVSTFRPPVIARHTDSVSNTYARGIFPNGITGPQKMLYPANAQHSETPEKLSIYPVTNKMLKTPVSAEESTDPHLAPGPWNDWDPEFDLQYQVQKECGRLWIEKHNKMSPQPNPAAVKSEMISQPDKNTGHQSDARKSDGDTTTREKTKNTRRVLHESMGWENAASPENSKIDFSMFDEFSRDQSILPEIEEWVLPPWDTVDDAPSPTDLSSIAEWDPSLDLEFQNEAQENLEKWSDCRFKVSQTPADIESLQRALEITRMDFWIKNPNERYPEDLSQYETESYASQQRRLQHAFCRSWRRFHGTIPPELFRLPNWMLGFEECYWKPSSWGYDRRSNAYNQGLAKMAAEKKEMGLWSVDYREWKARLTKPVVAGTA